MTKKRFLSENLVDEYVKWLWKEEKSCATIKKYQRDVLCFIHFAEGREVRKDVVIQYKEQLIQKNYAISSVNSMLVALNGLFTYLGWEECKVKTMRIQRQVYCPECKELSREEYLHLVAVAQAKEDVRMALLLQTVCSTGIRISELPYITVEAVLAGETTVYCKGKSRKIILVSAIQKQLYKYMEERGIRTGPIFITKKGKPIDRSNIWREMKKLSLEAGISVEKVSPHNLRHLFARTFYEADKDIAKLADVLGHSNIDTTRIYIITTENAHRKCMESLQLTI